MPPLPPLKDVLDVLYFCVVPAAGTAALVLGAFLLLGRWAAALGSAFAVTVAFVVANFAPPNITPEDPKPTWDNTSRFVLWKPVSKSAPGVEDAPPASPCEHWLPRAALVLVVVGLLTRWLGLGASRVLPERVWWVANLVVWLPRAVAVGGVCGWLVQGFAASKPEWEALRGHLAVAMILVWLVTDTLARSGLSAEVSAHLGAALFAGSAVLLYTHNLRFTELAVVVGSAMFGVAVIAGVLQVRAGGAELSASGAIPAAVAFLPGLLLGTRPSHNENAIPVVVYWLVALAPLVLAPFLVPRIARQNRWVLLALRVGLVVVPLLIALLICGQHAKLSWEEEPKW